MTYPMERQFTRSNVLLSVRNLSVPGGTTSLIRNISFDLSVGECIAVIGPNGCGKSTFINALIGTIARGHISLAGRPLTSYSRKERAKHIALLAQHDEPDPRLRVEEYVTLGRIPHYACSTPAHNTYLVHKALDETGIAALRNQRLGNLSGGERQKAALARAFAQTPSLLLLDEPTNHLDPLARTKILSLVRQKGIATLAVLHDLPLVEPFANRVMVMQDGAMVICDKPHKALSKRIMHQVFGMNSFTVHHPKTGLPIRLFEAPLCA